MFVSPLATRERWVQPGGHGRVRRSRSRLIRCFGQSASSHHNHRVFRYVVNVAHLCRCLSTSGCALRCYECAVNSSGLSRERVRSAEPGERAKLPCWQVDERPLSSRRSRCQGRKVDTRTRTNTIRVHHRRTRRRRRCCTCLSTLSTETYALHANCVWAWLHAVRSSGHWTTRQRPCLEARRGQQQQQQPKWLLHRPHLHPHALTTTSRLSDLSAFQDCEGQRAALCSSARNSAA